MHVTHVPNRNRNHVRDHVGQESESGGGEDAFVGGEARPASRMRNGGESGKHAKTNGKKKKKKGKAKQDKKDGNKSSKKTKAARNKRMKARGMLRAPRKAAGDAALSLCHSRLLCHSRRLRSHPQVRRQRAPGSESATLDRALAPSLVVAAAAAAARQPIPRPPSVASAVPSTV